MTLHSVVLTIVIVFQRLLNTDTNQEVKRDTLHVMYCSESQLSWFICLEHFSLFAESSLQTPQGAWLPLGHSLGSKRHLWWLERRAGSFASPWVELWLPGCVCNATPRSLSALERNITQAFLFLSPSRQLFIPFAPPALSKCRTVIPLQRCTGFPQAALWEQSCLPSPLWVKTLQDPVKGQK